MSTIQRVTGTNSGLDVDALVKASMTTYQNKIDKETQNKKVLEYQQAQYEQIMNDSSDFYDKYFDILKTGNLMSTSTYQTQTFTSTDGSKVTAKGLAGANVDNYTVSITELAAKASDKLDLDTETGTDKTITIGTSTIKFDVVADGSTTVSNYNTALAAKKKELSDLVTAGTATTDQKTELTALNANTITATYSQFTNSVNFTASAMGGSGFTLNSHAKAEDKYLEATIKNSSGDVYTINSADKKTSNSITIDNVQFDFKGVSASTSATPTGSLAGVTALAEDGTTTTTTAADGTKTTVTKSGATTTTRVTKSGDTTPTTTITEQETTDGSKTTVVAADGKTTTTQIKVGTDGKTTKTVTTSPEAPLTELTSLTELPSVTDDGINTKTVGTDGTTTTTTLKSTDGTTTIIEKVIADGTTTTTTTKDGTTTIIANDGTITTTKAGTQTVKSTNGTKTTTDGTTITTTDGTTITTTKDGKSTVTTATTYSSPTSLTGATDVTALKDKIVSFVNDYNTLLSSINTKIYETRDKDYMPLTDTQKEAMTDDQITSWEKKAQTGLLRKDSDLERITSAMKSAMSSVMSGSGLYLEKIGISPVQNYAEKNGMLTIDEDKLTTALEEDAGAVKDLFTRAVTTVTNSTTGKDEVTDKGGVLTQLKASLYSEFKTSTSTLSKKAGLTGTSTQYDNTLTNNIYKKKLLIADLNSSFTDKETALYNKYSALETALQTLNSQQASLTSMLG